MTLNAIIATLVLLFAVAVLLAVLVRLLRRPFMESLSLTTLAISIPKGEKDDKANLIDEINKSEKFFDALAAIKQPVALEMAVHNSGEAIHFYLAVPRANVDFASRQIQGLFPRAQVKPASDYTIFATDGAASAATFKLKSKAVLPIRTYREAEVDTFAPVVSTFSQLNELGEGAVFQLVLRPAGERARQSITGAIARLKKGDKLSDVISTAFFKPDEVAKLFQAENKTKKAASYEPPKPLDEEAIKALQQKVSKPLFSVNARVITAATEAARAEGILLAVTNALTQFTAPLRNSLITVRPRKNKQLIFNYIFREFERKEALTLNSEELASLFHLPTFSTDVPRIAWQKGTEAPPPANLPNEGVVLGENIFRGEKRPVRLLDDDRRRHLYVVGQTGTGKSYLMLNLAVQDMAAGKGLAVIDPHGELVDKILGLVPPERVDDVIVFNPGDLSRPLGLNMLEYNLDRPEEKTFIVNEIQSIFNRLFDKETMGPMFEQYMRNSLLLLMEDAKYEPATLMEVPRIFTDPEFRKKKLARATNPTVIDFWEKEAVKTSGEQGLANMTPYITSKFGNFIANDYMRPIIGQPQSAFNFREVMDGGKILLVNLAKGRIGDINAGLLGMIITGRLLLAALSRTDVDEAKRRDFYLYIDEFQNFTTDSIAVILSEARKYRLDLILAHQFIAQLTDQIREAVFGNVGSLAAFRVGPPDTEALIKHFGPTFTERDLTTIENQMAIARTLIKGEPSVPFNFKTITTLAGSDEVKEKLKELSRLTYGRDLAEVEQEILTRLRG